MAIPPNNLQSTPGQLQRLKIFLSHASGDKAIVREIYQRLLLDGFAPWLDDENLIPGQDWNREIRKAVNDTDKLD
jgi:hypothetical protein